MALKLKSVSGVPYGQFDGYDLDYLTIKGGEVGRIIGVPYSFPSTGDKAAFDSFDGYSYDGYVKRRPVVSHTLTATASTYRPLFLLDEGVAGYGTMLGTVVGGVVGQASTVVGPHTATGTGKVTCWNCPGLFGVTLDAVASSIDPKTSTPTPGAPLYANVNGQLTLTAGEAFDTSGTATIVGRFMEFTTNGSLVTTPQYLALGSSAVTRQFTEMLFTFGVEN